MSDYPPLQNTVAEVFIIESLSLDDEVHQRFEGKILADILRLVGKKPLYYYFRTERELREIAKVYRKSGYRFLHISSHGSPTELFTTFETVTYVELSRIFKGFLKNRRLFVSACEMGSEMFAEVIAGTNKGMYSIVAPSQRIRFDRAAALWAAFYVLMFDLDSSYMKSHHIIKRIKSLSDLFSEGFHFSWYDPSRDRWRHEQIN